MGDKLALCPLCSWSNDGPDADDELHNHKHDEHRGEFCKACDSTDDVELGEDDYLCGDCRRSEADEAAEARNPELFFGVSRADFG